MVFFLRKRKRKTDDNDALPTYTPVAPHAPDEGKGELHGDSRVVLPVPQNDGRVVSMTEPYGVAEHAGTEKVVHLKTAELEGGFHATVSPSDFAAPDPNVGGHGTEGRYELDTRR